jgi:hypothetical protein
MKLNIGDLVILKSNPFEVGEFLMCGEKLIVDIKDTSDLTGETSSLWVMIEGYNDWIDSTWFTKKNN